MQKSPHIGYVSGSTLWMVTLIALGTTAPTVAQQVTAPGAALQQVSQEFIFTEGPAVDQAGNVYFHGSAS